jgi:C1A family cysteine protease
MPRFWERIAGNQTVVSSMVAIGLSVLILLAAVSSGYAQLTDQDIAALKKQGQEEGWTFEVSKNEATQYPLDQICGLKPPANWQENAHYVDFPNKADLPASFDWRDATGLPPIRNQGGCGSCWAFATVGPLECDIKIRDNDVVDLSEQWLVSCNHEGWGCAGGWFAHDYFLNATDACGQSGAVYESDYPYTASDAACSCPDPHPYHINSWAYIGNGNSVASVNAMKQAIMEYGPISVAIFANNAMQAYHGGVFNGCSTGQINHAVTIVGWDDNQGTNGVWFLRNSWGTSWGESGYMRIPYNCNSVGYAACYIDYQISGLYFSVDSACGCPPHEVNFAASSPLNVSSWTWDFGDGDSAFVQSPSHMYSERGCYNVTLQAETNVGVKTQIRQECVVVEADTLTAENQTSSAGQTVEFTISTTNTAPLQTIRIPVEYGGDFTMSFDSMSTVGCRTDYFQDQGLVHYDPFNRRFTLRLAASSSGTEPELAPGTGPIVKLYMTVPSNATSGQTATITMDGYDSYQPTFSNENVSYKPSSTSAVVTLEQSVVPGDCDGNGTVDIADVIYLVEYSFNSGPAPSILAAGDVDCNGAVDISDLIYMVDYMFSSGPAPCVGN